MSKLRFRISMSLDGYVAGPDQSVKEPLGVGGEHLHDWIFPLAAWRSMHGQEGGEVNASSAVVEESVANIGATIMGRNMFGGHPGPWDAKKPWTGWVQWNRVDRGPMIESVCAENNANFFNLDEYPMPQAKAAPSSASWSTSIHAKREW